MPRATRSQGEPLADPLTPSRERSTRTRRPIVRVLADTHAEAVDQDLARRRERRAVENRREQASRAETAGEHPHTGRAREARGSRKQAQSREMAAHNRRDAKRDRKSAEWEEEEALLRRREVQELQRDRDELDTSEVDANGRG